MKARYLILIFISVWACKSIKKTPSPTVSIPIDSIAKDVEIDTIYLITQKGDTLKSLNEEINIPIERLLPDTVTIAAVGDIMAGTNFPDRSYLPGGNGAYLWDDVRSILQQADITFGNLEGTILNDGGEQKECNNPKLCYLFRSPEYLAQNFVESGFDLMSVANNHANDFGETGRKNTKLCYIRCSFQ